MPDTVLARPSVAGAAGAGLVVENLSVAFASRAGWLQALDGVSLAVPRGGVLGLVGESGSGKSTALLALLGLLGPSARVGAERLAFDGCDLLRDAPALRGRRLGMVFQDTAAALNPALTVGRQITEPMLNYPHQLSGGMKQRVGIARALASRPGFLVCDEAVSALDVSVQAAVLNLLRDLRDELRVAVLFISHDIGVVAHVADRVVVMFGGSVMEQGSTASVLRPPYHPYTELLLSSVPLVGKPRAAPPAPGGRQDAAPGGCKFAARCPRHLGPVCETRPPPWQQAGPGHPVPHPAAGAGGRAALARPTGGRSRAMMNPVP